MALPRVSVASTAADLPAALEAVPGTPAALGDVAGGAFGAAAGAPGAEAGTGFALSAPPWARSGPLNKTTPLSAQPAQEARRLTSRLARAGEPADRTVRLDRSENLCPCPSCLG